MTSKTCSCFHFLSVLFFLIAYSNQQVRVAIRTWIFDSVLCPSPAYRPQRERSSSHAEHLLTQLKYSLSFFLSLTDYISVFL